MKSSRESQKIRKAEKIATKAARRLLRANLVDSMSLKEIPTPSGVLLAPFKTKEDGSYLPGFKGQIGQLESLFVGKDMDEVLDDPMYLTYFSRDKQWRDLIRLGKRFADPMISDRESEFETKVGPYYLDHYKTWAKKVHASFTPDTLTINPLLIKAVNAVADEYRSCLEGPQHIGKPSSYIGLMETKSSTGYPFFTSQWGGELAFEGCNTPAEWGMAVSDDMVESGDFSKLLNSPFTMFTRRGPRGVIANPTVGLKATERPVQCSPLLERFVAIGFQKTIMNVQRELNFSQGLKGSQHMTTVISDTIKDFNGCLEADYSAFDTSIDRVAMTLVFDEIFKPLFMEEHHAQLDAVKTLYLNPELLTPQGVMSGEASLMSGSMLTNAIGMAWGHIAWVYFTMRMAEEGKTFKHVAYGYSDDLCVFLDKDVSADFSRIVAELNLTAHTEKQRFSEGDDRTTSFLGNVYSPKWSGGKRPFNRVLPKLIWREHLDHDTDVRSDNYTTEGLTTFESEAVKLLQRLDSLGSNSDYDSIVYHFCSDAGIQIGRLNRVINAKTMTPSIAALRRLTDSGALQLGEPTIVDATPLSEADMAELKELIHHFHMEEDEEANDMIRKCLKKLRKVRKGVSKRESNDKILKTFPSCSLDQRDSSLDLRDSPDGCKLRGQFCLLAHRPTQREESGVITVARHGLSPNDLIEWGNGNTTGIIELRDLLQELRKYSKIVTTCVQPESQPDSQSHNTATLK